jgi:hypothetical protein
MAENLTSKFKDKLLRALPSTRKKRDASEHQDPRAESNDLSVPRLPETAPVVSIADVVRMYFSSPIDKCVPSQSCSRCRATRNKPGQTNTMIPAWPDRICLEFISKYASARCLQCYVFWMALSSMADSIHVGESVGYVGRLSITIGGLKGGVIILHYAQLMVSSHIDTCCIQLMIQEQVHQKPRLGILRCASRYTRTQLLQNAFSVSDKSSKAVGPNMRNVAL